MANNGAYTWAQVGEFADGAPVGIPVAQFGSGRAGKRVWVQATVHGDEFNGIEICHRLCRMLDEATTLRGQVTIVPVVHGAALVTATRNSSIDFMNLASTYPGSASGFLTEQIAHWNVAAIKEAAPDVAFDLHTGSVFGIACGYAICPPKSDQSSAFAGDVAYWFGVPYAYQPPEDRNSFKDTLGKAGVPALTLELGGGASVQEDYVSMGLRGLVQVLRWLEILDGDPEGPTSQVVLRERRWTRISKGGLFRPLVPPAARVQRGQPIGEVIDWHAQVKEVIESPYDGVILLERRHPVVRTGDWAILVGNMVGSEVRTSA